MNPHTQNPAKLAQRITELEQTLKDLEIHILSAMMNDERDNGAADVSLPWMLETIRAVKKQPTSEAACISE